MHACLVERQSISPCVYNVSFGCEPSDNAVWVRGGCRGLFQLPGVPVLACGFAGMRDGNHRRYCRPPALTSADADCDCLSTSTLEAGQGIGVPGRRVCDAPALNATWACSGGGGGGPATCCATSASGECSAGWARCRWHGEQRIGWVHTPKTGTSFLTTLAHLANSTLPADAAVSNRTKMLYWDKFFHHYPPQVWFRGSAIFWRAGIAHAPLSREVFDEYNGRLFTMIRDPRARGWSAYRFFTWDKGASQHMVSPQLYATCISGIQTMMITGEMPNQAFGGVCAHLVEHGACVRGHRKDCMSPPAPDMKLAHRRLREGFAFVGLTEQWPLSICLFAAMFRIACVPSLFDDSRPTPMRHEARTRSAGAPSPPPATEDAELFADPYDMQLWRWATTRFHADLSRYNVTRGRCERVICPAAATHFLDE